MRKLFASVAKTWSLVRPFWRYGTPYMLGLLFFAAVVGPLKALLNVLFIREVLNFVGRPGSFSNVALLIGAYFAFQLVTTLAQRAFDMLYAEKKRVLIHREMELAVLRKTVATDFQYFDDPEFYDNYTLVLKEYTARADEAQTLFVEVCSSVVTLLSMFAYISVLGPWILLISLVQLAVSLGIDVRRSRLNFARRSAVIPAERKMDYVNRTFYNKEAASDIKCTRAEQLLLGLYNENCEQKASVIGRYARPLFGWTSLLEGWTSLYNAGIFAYISYAILVAGRIDGAGSFMGLLAANGHLMTSLHSFYKFASQSVHLGLYAEKIAAFFAVPSPIERPALPPAEEPPAGPLAVEFRGVDFTYPHSGFRLQQVSFSIRPGERVAVVGDNGAGKTTLVKLLLRLYDVSSGQLLVGGRPVQHYRPAALRRAIGVCFQKPNLYALSYAENVGLYDPLPPEKVEEVTRLTDLQGALAKSEAGLQAPVTKEFSKDGVVFSGGEMQKLGIARLLGRPFGLLIFDEPSAALDPLAEQEIMAHIYNKQNAATTLIIAHRLSTVVQADRIVVLQNGRVCESGTHAELMARRGRYYTMFTVQARQYAAGGTGPRPGEGA